MGIREWLIPQEKFFFDFLERQVSNVSKGAKFLNKLVRNYKNIGLAHKRMKKIEHDGDDIAHEFYHKLDHTFITPFDYEDLTLLVSLFDDILDRCYAVTNRLYFYKIEKPTPDIKKFISIINKQLVHIEKAAKRIRKMEQEEINKCCVEVHRLENLGDEFFDKATANLFLKEHDIKKIIKLKEIYSLLEETTDKCENAAIAIREVVTKNV